MWITTRHGLISVIVFIIFMTGNIANWLCAATSKVKDEKDIKGWNIARWGMTSKEILTVFKGQAVQVEKKPFGNGKTYSEIKIQNYEIDGKNFEVTFCMGGYG